MVKELDGLYNVGPYRIFKISFPYKAHGVYIYCGAPDDAKAAAKKLQAQIKHPYAAKVTEITKSFQ